MKNNMNRIFAVVFTIVVVFLVNSCSSIKPKVIGNLYPIYVNGKGGYIDASGKIIIEPKLRHISRFSEGLAFVSADYSSFFINQLGEPVIYLADSSFVQKCAIHISGFSFGKFSEGLATVTWFCGENQKATFINRNGKNAFEEAISHQNSEQLPSDNSPEGWDRLDYIFEDVSQFSEGLAAVKEGGKWGYINHKGEYVIKNKYDYAEPFYQGLAIVHLNGEKGMINKHGEFVVKPKRGNLLVFFFPEFDRTYMLVINSYRTYKDGIYKDMTVKFINIYTGKQDIPGYFLGAALFNEGVARVVYRDKNGQKKYGFIDYTGKFVIDPQFDDACEFFEGLVAVKIAGKWGFVNHAGEMVIKPQYDDIGAMNDDGCFGFKNGIARVGIKKGDDSGDILYGYINQKGEYIWKPSQ